MKKIITIIALVASAMLVGCTTSYENTGNMNSLTTTVVLQEKNYHVVRQISAEATQSYFLGLGGGIRENAIAKMYQRAELTGSQAIINEIVTYKKYSGFFISRVTCTAQGTIIEFDK